MVFCELNNILYQKNGVTCTRVPKRCSIVLEYLAKCRIPDPTLAAPVTSIYNTYLTYTTYTSRGADTCRQLQATFTVFSGASYLFGSSWFTAAADYEKMNTMQGRSRPWL